MKKIIAITMIVVVALFLLAACGSKNGGSIAVSTGKTIKFGRTIHADCKEANLLFLFY